MGGGDEIAVTETSGDAEGRRRTSACDAMRRR